MRSDFGALADINAENDNAEMVLGPVPIVSVDATSWFGQWVLIALFAILAGRMLRTENAWPKQHRRK